MGDVNIIVMGKTGAGKSTLINAILGEHRAKTGTGSAQTMKNEPYRTWKRGRQVELLDTVGLELNSSLTRKTLYEIKKHIQNMADEYMNDYSDLDEVHMVWFCINPNNNRFEDLEINFIRNMREEYEIPFMIVLTQCWDSDQADAMKREIFQPSSGSSCTKVPSIPSFAATPCAKVSHLLFVISSVPTPGCRYTYWHPRTSIRQDLLVRPPLSVSITQISSGEHSSTAHTFFTADSLSSII